MDFLSFFKDRWNTILQVAVILTLIISEFTIPPQFKNGLIEDQVNFASLAKFLTIGLLLLVLIPAYLFKSKKMVWIWWVGAVLTLGVALAAYFHYNDYVNVHSVVDEDAGSRIIVGDSVVPQAKIALDSFTRAHPNAVLTKAQWVQGLGGADKVFDGNQIMSYSHHIVYSYLITVICFSLFVICGIQALYIVSATKES